MISSCSRVLHQLQRQIVLWDRFFTQLRRFQRHHLSMGFFPHTVEASHFYLWHCFFLRGGTPFCSLGSTSSLEQSLASILLVGGGGSLSCLSSSSHYSLMYILDVCCNGWVLITPSIHTLYVFLISLFGGGFFP